MKRSVFGVALMATIAVAFAFEVSAAPKVTKQVVDEDGKRTVLVTVTASDFTVYGIDIDGGDIASLKAPKGWVGITNGDRTIFRTGETPVKSGGSVTFRLYSSSTDGKLAVSFRDDKNKVRGSGTI